jgi:hypothetical protein
MIMETISGFGCQVSGLRDEQKVGPALYPPFFRRTVPAGFNRARRTSVLLATLRLFLRPET